MSKTINTKITAINGTQLTLKSGHRCSMADNAAIKDMKVGDAISVDIQADSRLATLAKKKASKPSSSVS